MLTAGKVKQRARELGADIVGIAPVERWEGAPKQMDPRYIMPEAKSMIVMGFRFMRGSLRGIEEGTFFSNYSSMGYGALNYIYMPMVVINLCKMIEDDGYEAVPLGHLSDWRAIDNGGELKPNFSRPVEPGKPTPDVMIHHRIAAYLAGLGEFGWSKVFLTPEFGPRQRLGHVLTEAELEPDPIYDGPQLCDRCMLCVRHCPADAISEKEKVQVELAGNTVEWGEIDIEACDVYFRGGEYVEEGETGEYMARQGRDDVKPGEITPFPEHPRTIYNVGKAICGGRGCIRPCMMHLEERGVIKNTFKKPFRRRKPWKVDWSTDRPQ